MPSKPVPTSKAVMFCLMDVSGSMDQATKDIAKRFYILLYLFLSRTYKTIDVVYIRHHTQAKEVDEQEFFYSQETGGTIASSALELMINIIADRYNENEWNIYGAQASDGDNWADDSPHCQNILCAIKYCLKLDTLVISKSHSVHIKALWQQYAQLADGDSSFSIATY